MTLKTSALCDDYLHGQYKEGSQQDARVEEGPMGKTHKKLILYMSQFLQSYDTSFQLYPDLERKAPVHLGNPLHL